MNKRDIIQLKPNANIPCLKIWCGACGTVVKVCKKNGKALSQCEHLPDLTYRAVVYRPGTKNRVVRSLGKDFNKAVESLSVLRQEVENGNDDVPVLAHQKSQVASAIHSTQQSGSRPELLLHVFARYIAWLENEGVASHLVRSRSSSHKRDVKNCFRQFALALKAQKYNVQSMRLIDVDNHVIGKFHDYLNAKGYAPRTYNKFFGYLSTFASWADVEGYGDIRSCINRVHRKSVPVHPETITSKEFDTLIRSITPESGYQYGVGKRNEKKIIYRDYLVSGFLFALLTGRRVEEILQCKWNDLLTDEKGKLSLIRFFDYKVSRILHGDPNDRPLYTPVTDELSSFLNGLGLHKHKNPDHYILAPEITHNRIPSMRQGLSRGFSHYWNIAFPNAEKQLTFKCLRKTYLTSVSLFKNSDVREISGHASDQVLRHYIDPKQAALVSSLKDFTVFEAVNTPEKSKVQSKKKHNNISR